MTFADSLGSGGGTAEEDAYPKGGVGGYSVRMPGELSESILSPTALLWLAAVIIAGMILIGSINRRRTRLTETLRDYVDRNQEGRQSQHGNGDETTSE
ncbi:MAG: hypothetical protein ACR2NZ_25150 [Rubripirellula sp.]